MVVIPFFYFLIVLCSYLSIDETSIAKAALKTKGAAGPSGQDADGWRRILVSKNYGDAGRDLRSAIAEMMRSLCCREVPVIPGTEKQTLKHIPLAG